MSLARRVLLGSAANGSPRRRRLLVPPLLFVWDFAAYAFGVFSISGGVVFLAGQAAVLGVLAAAVLAYRRGGLALAWATVYGALLGQNADHYLLGLPGRPLGERVVALVGLDGLAFVGVEGPRVGDDRLGRRGGRPPRRQARPGRVTPLDPATVGYLRDE